MAAPHPTGRAGALAVDRATSAGRDPAAKLHLLDTGHFALEEDGDRIASLIGEVFAAPGKSQR